MTENIRNNEQLLDHAGEIENVLWAMNLIIKSDKEFGAEFLANLDKQVAKLTKVIRNSQAFYEQDERADL
jgi:hypothetical protein